MTIKLSFCVACAVIGVLFLQTYGQTYGEGCLGTLKRESDVYRNLLKNKLPTTRVGKCIYVCMLREAEVVNDDNLIDVKKFIDTFNEIQLNNQTINLFLEIVKNCPSQIIGNACEFMGHYLECAVQEGAKHNLTTEAVMSSIRSPYYYMNQAKRQ